MKSAPFKRLNSFMAALNAIMASGMMSGVDKAIKVSELRSPIGKGKARGKKAHKQTGICAAKRIAKRKRNIEKRKR